MLVHMAGCIRYCSLNIKCTQQPAHNSCVHQQLNAAGMLLDRPFAIIRSISDVLYPPLSAPLHLHPSNMQGVEWCRV